MTYTPGALRAAYEAISDAGIAVASGNPSLLVHKYIDAAKDAIKQAGEERRGLLEALKKITAQARSWHDFHHGSQCVQCDSICECLPECEKAIATAERGEG